MDFPKISIVTPNLNRAQYLEETIKSVLDQGYPNLEYIIIDGGSADGSIDIIKKYEPRLAYWESEPDRGMYHAIQKGFKKSTGEIMAWINSDDMYHKNSLYTVAEIFTSFEQVTWLVGASTAYDEYGRTVLCSQTRSFSKFDFYNYDFKWLQQESVFWKRSLWEKAGSTLNVNLKYAGDLELWLRFFQHEKLLVTDALIGGFRWHNSNQITLEHIEEYLNEAKKEIDKIELSKSEKKVLMHYQRLQKLVSLLNLLKIFKTNVILSRYRSKYFQYSNKVVFDRKIMKFKIC